MKSVTRLFLLVTICVVQLQAQSPRRSRLPANPSAGIISQLPSYGGAWLDTAGVLHATLTDMKDSARLRIIMEPRRTQLGDGIERPIRPVVIEKAKYTNAQLFDWRCTVEKAALGEWNGAGVGERSNRVELTVANQPSVDKVRKIIRSLGLPADAFSFRFGDPVRLYEANRTIAPRQ